MIETESIEKVEVDTELKEALEVFDVQSFSYKEEKMIAFLELKLSKIKDVNYTIDVNGNILVVKGTPLEGKTYPGLAAHMDTVHDYREHYKVNVDTSTDETKIFATGLDPKRCY